MNENDVRKLIDEALEEKNKEIDFWRKKSQLPPAGKFKLSQKSLH